MREKPINPSLLPSKLETVLWTLWRLGSGARPVEEEGEEQEHFYGN